MIYGISGPFPKQMNLSDSKKAVSRPIRKQKNAKSRFKSASAAFDTFLAVESFTVGVNTQKALD